MKKKLLFLIPLFLILTHCKKDDDEPEYVIREYSDQVNVDHLLIEDYLRTHTFNYDDFNNQTNIDVKIDTLTDSNSNKKSLYELSNVKTIDVIDSNGENVSHNLYYIIAREGLNEKPSVADSVYISYRGLLTDGYVFDKRKFPIWFDLAVSLEGFREGVSELKTGNFSENSDGTISYNSFGVGLRYERGLNNNELLIINANGIDIDNANIDTTTNKLSLNISYDIPYDLFKKKD